MTDGHDRDRPGDPAHDPAHEVRVEMDRAVAGLGPVDLLTAVHLRAGRIRRRRRVAGGVAAAVSAAAVVAAGATLPALVSRNDPAAVVAARPTPMPTPSPPADRAPTATAPAGETPPSGTPPNDPAPPGTGAPPPIWGATTMDEDFGWAPGRAWKAYEGPGDDLGSWSPGNVAVSGGALRLSVSRPGGDPPSRWGGVGAAGSAQRYGRWEARIRMSTGRGILGQFVLSPAPEGSGAPVIVVSVAPYADTISVTGTGTGSGGSRTAALRRPGDYHTVAVEWTPARVRVLLDGQRLFEWTDGRLSAPLWPALQTIMAGPDCGAVPVSADCRGTTVTFPQRFDVDWFKVRAYRG
jgi:hypothetical protein